MPTIYGLTEDDLKVLKALVEESRQRPVSVSSVAGIKPDLEPAPELYVVRIPHGGLPGAAVGETGTGTDDLVDDVPGQARCEVYRAIGDGPTLQMIDTGVMVDILNLSSTGRAEGEWAVVARDKYGYWYLVNTTIGGGPSPAPSAFITVKDYQSSATFSSINTIMVGAAVDWKALVAPAGTPPEIVERLHFEVERALKQPATLERMASEGSAPMRGSIPEMARFVRAEHARWGTVVREANVKLD